jgi:hypothetical protein
MVAIRIGIRVDLGRAHGPCDHSLDQDPVSQKFLGAIPNELLGQLCHVRKSEMPIRGPDWAPIDKRFSYRRYRYKTCGEKLAGFRMRHHSISITTDRALSANGLQFKAELIG